MIKNHSEVCATNSYWNKTLTYKGVLKSKIVLLWNGVASQKITYRKVRGTGPKKLNKSREYSQIHTVFMRHEYNAVQSLELYSSRYPGTWWIGGIERSNVPIINITYHINLLILVFMLSFDKQLQVLHTSETFLALCYQSLYVEFHLFCYCNSMQDINRHTFWSSRWSR